MSKHISLRIEDGLFDTIQDLAEKQDRSRNWIVEQLIKAGLKVKQDEQSKRQN